MVASRPGFATTHRAPMVVSALAHGLLLLALSSSLMIFPDKPAPQLAIEAVVIDEGAIRKAAADEQRRREAAAAEEQRRRDEAARQQRVQREQEAARQREAEQRRQQQAEQQRQAKAQEAERQRQAAAQEAQRRKEAEQRRVAEERAAAERQRQAEAERQRKAAAEKARLEKERLAAEARAAEEARKREQARRQAELAAALEAEEALASARQSGAMNRYVALIQQRVESKWRQPASAVTGVECEVVVQQLPSGDVASVEVSRCNGDDVVRRSVEEAVYRASPLPLPDDRRLFERYLRFTFRPGNNS